MPPPPPPTPPHPPTPPPTPTPHPPPPPTHPTPPLHYLQYSNNGDTAVYTKPSVHRCCVYLFPFCKKQHHTSSIQRYSKQVQIEKKGRENSREDIFVRNNVLFLCCWFMWRGRNLKIIGLHNSNSIVLWQFQQKIVKSIREAHSNYRELQK